jgi:hypothetical protein
LMSLITVSSSGAGSMGGCQIGGRTASSSQPRDLLSQAKHALNVPVNH